MFDAFCHFGNWGSLNSFGAWGWVGLALILIVWLGLSVGFTLLAAWAIRRAGVSAATAPHAAGQPSAKEILQAQYARGEITREQYRLMNQDIG